MHHMGGGGVTSESSITPVHRLKLADAVAAQLESLIQEGEYQVGDKLPPEREFAEQFGVGRSTMREALRLVEAGGLLRINHGIGVFVQSRTRTTERGGLLVLDEVTVPELFEVRRSLERDAAGLAAKRITSAEGDALLAILTESEVAELTDEQYVILDAAFHRKIAEITKNRLLVGLTATIEPLFLQYSRQVICLPDRRKTAMQGHRSIADAIIQRKVEGARRAALAHLREVESDIVVHLHGRTTAQ